MEQDAGEQVKKWTNYSYSTQPASERFCMFTGHISNRNLLSRCEQGDMHVLIAQKKMLELDLSCARKGLQQHC